MAEIFRDYKFSAAHHLTVGIPEGHKCRRYHGHTYMARITLSGKPDEHGLLLEFGIMDRCVKPIIGLVDHHDLNTLNQRCSTEEAILVATNPTSERIVTWLGTRMAVLESAAGSRRIRVDSIMLHESEGAGSVWRPDAI